MYPDIENAVVNDESISSVINDMDWVENEFLPTVQQRGKAVIDARGASSATSAAKAALDTVIACENPTDSNDCFSAAVESDGSYGVPEGLICGFPLSSDDNGIVTIKKGLELSDFAKQKFQVSIDELISERQAVEHLMK